jgi:hypothetical protein
MEIDMYYKGLLIKESIRNSGYKYTPKPNIGKECDCGLGVTAHDHTCYRCGGHSFLSRPTFKYPKYTQAKFRIGQFVNWKGTQCEIDWVDETNPITTYVLVDCKTLDFYRNVFETDLNMTTT